MPVPARRSLALSALCFVVALGATVAASYRHLDDEIGLNTGGGIAPRTQELYLEPEARPAVEQPVSGGAPTTTAAAPSTTVPAPTTTTAPRPAPTTPASLPDRPASPQSGGVYGRVVNADGEPLSGICATAVGVAGPILAPTDVHGWFVLDGLVPGAQTVGLASGDPGCPAPIQLVTGAAPARVVAGQWTAVVIVAELWSPGSDADAAQ